MRAAEGLVDIFASFPYDDNYETYCTEGGLTGRFKAFGMAHSVLFGAEYYRNTNEQDFLSVDSDSETFFDTDGVIPIRPLDLNNAVYQRTAELPAIAAANYEFPISFATKSRDYWYAV